MKPKTRRYGQHFDYLCIARVLWELPTGIVSSPRYLLTDLIRQTTGYNPKLGSNWQQRGASPAGSKPDTRTPAVGTTPRRRGINQGLARGPQNI